MGHPSQELRLVPRWKDWHLDAYWFAELFDKMAQLTNVYISTRVDGDHSTINLIDDVVDPLSVNTWINTMGYLMGRLTRGRRRRRVRRL